MGDFVGRNSNYFFPAEPVPRFSHLDQSVDKYIAGQKPVVVTDSGLCSSAHKWDLDYLSDNLEGEHTVYTSKTNKFKYFDESKQEKQKVNFAPSIRRTNMKFDEFKKEIFEWTPGKDRLYLQQTLNNTVGAAIVKDYINFNWSWIRRQQLANQWGSLTSNLLLVAMHGNITPAHYDEQHNFFAQLQGHKKCYLFPPECYENLYPHPVYHPHDRQSQVDFDAPDFERFPRLRDLRGYETVVGPGDVLYIPMYWWHHIESLSSNATVSVNFWYKAGSNRDISFPLEPRLKLAVMRNVEKMLSEALQDPAEVGPLLRSLVMGRYTHKDYSDLEER